MNFLFDIVSRLGETFTSEKLEKLLEDYPSKSFIFVTMDQKREICGFGGNSTRYVDTSDGPFFPDDKHHLTRDLLCFDGANGSYYIVTIRDLEGIEKTKKKLFGGKRIRIIFSK